MNLYSETKKIMKHYNISANKKLGQNFLIADDVVEKIIEAAEISEEDLIIEIGPGLGTLTKLLLENAGKVICIELDERMLKILQDRFALYQNFEVIHEDILNINLKELIEKNKIENIKKVKVVANLPYYITTPIIMKLLEEKLEIESITVMVQKEVADRLVAIPGEKETGAITYTIAYYTNAKKVVNVENTSFIPAPEVNSAVIKLDVLNKPKIEVKNEGKLFKLIKTAFSQKRKTLLNALTNSNLYGTKEEIEEVLKSLNIDLKIRGEKLSLEEYGILSEKLI